MENVALTLPERSVLLGKSFQSTVLEAFAFPRNVENSHCGGRQPIPARSRAMSKTLPLRWESLV